MDSVLLESPSEAKSPGFGSVGGSNHAIMLKESIDRFLIEIQKDKGDFSGFRSIFFRLLQSRADPPLEIIWFYSAVSYHEHISSKKDLLGRVLGVRDLFQLLLACSASCDGSKCIALLAPVLSELYKCVIEEKRTSEMLSGKAAAEKVKREIECLVEGIVSYISICSSKCSSEQDASTGLLPCFVDLVRVWTLQRSDRGGGGLSLFLPMVNDEIRDRFGKGECGISYMAGVVIAEAFLLRLCLKVQAGGVSRPELRQELRIWAVSSITGFRNRDLFETLLRLLLDPTLPVIAILSPKDETFVRDILYDAVILVEYSFLNPGTELEQSYGSMKSLAMTRLIVTHEAIRLARAKGDHAKAISYINAFSTSYLPSRLIKWVTNQIGMEKLNRPNATTPQVLLKWFMSLEEQGLKLFEDDIAELHTKLIFDESNVVCEDPMSNPDVKKADGDLFFLDNQGEVAEGAKDEEMESMDSVFLAAARMMKLPASNGRRKRKERRGGEGETQVKFVKYKIHDTSVKDHFVPSVADGISSGSEIENPLSDEDMEETEQ